MDGARDLGGPNPFDLICITGDLDRVQEAFESDDHNHRHDPYAVGYAAQAGQIPVMRYLLDNGTPVHQWAVVAACRGGFVPVFDVLVEYGWNPREEGYLRWQLVFYYIKV
jgi:hypothetical protein